MRALYKTFISAVIIVGIVTNAGAVNHNAVVISGYRANPDKTEDPKFEGMAYAQAFWIDTYLMWELLYQNALYELQGSAPDYDHIHVFYSNGQDYNLPDWLSQRYMVAHQFPEIEKITDYTYYKDDIFQVLDWLAQGGGGIDPMTNEDNFFLYVIAHGSPEGYFGVAHGTETISNVELKEKIDAITCSTKTL